MKTSLLRFVDISTVLLIAIFVIMTSRAHAADNTKPAAPDTIFVNADVYLGEMGAEGGGVRRVQALAVRDGRIVAAGSDADVRKLKGKNTKVMDLGGHFVMPGFNDAHLHLGNAGIQATSVDLVGSPSLSEMLGRIGAAAKSLPPGEWIRGRGWDHTLWPDKSLPTRQDLDKVTGDHPAFFQRVDGHIAIANTLALRAAGITAGTPDPHGGKIDRDATGAPTGIVREDSAMNLVTRRIPRRTPQERRRGLELALADAARWGVTSVQDNSDWEDFLVLEELEREGKLPIRVTEWLDFEDDVKLLSEHRARHAASDLMLHTGMLKGFMDGSLGSRTAAMLQPYRDDPGNSGLPRFEQPQLNAMTAERALAGFQVGFHAIGDGAAEMALNAFADAERVLRERHAGKSASDLRFRLEHAQVTTPEQVGRCKELGVIASVQPNHLLTDMRWAEERIGPERAKHSYAWREFLAAGVTLVFGTDYPVEPVTPFRGVYAAVTRKDEAGKQSYYPEQKLTIDEAIAAYTSGAAFADFAEKDKGTLAPGMLADFVVLDRDITRVPPDQILKTRVLRTVVGGKTVYQAP